MLLILHKEVSSTKSQLKSNLKAVGNTIKHGFGRPAAFIAGGIVAAITKVVAFSSCLATGGASALIMIPAAVTKGKMWDGFRS